MKPPWAVRSLGGRMAVVFSVLLVAMGVFMLAYFPARMATQAQRAVEERCVSLTHVMASALGPAVEFDDPDNAAQMMQWLNSTEDARFGVVYRGDGTLLAVWRPGQVPSGKNWSTATAVETSGDMMYVTTPIAGTGGLLHLGFSLAHLAHDRDEIRTTVAYTAALVVAVGICATLLLAAMLLRPIRVITRTARKIARGELPPELPRVAGTEEIVEMAAALRDMIERIHEVSQTELLRASRQAGMAEVATGVLHNVGNVLTSVNVTVELLREQIDAMPLARVRRVQELIAAHHAAGTLGEEQIAIALKFVGLVADTLERSQLSGKKELATLAGHVEHIKRVVAMQNAYARLRSAPEPTRIADVLAEALEMGCPPPRNPDITLAVHTAPALAETVNVDRHRVLQILVNLVSNARDAVTALGGPQTVTVTATREDADLRIEVRDSGVGVAPELAAQIFGAGITSKAHGHGYGLHSSALAAREMDGTLVCTSDGAGQGAAFVLRIPIQESRS